jgi:F420-dependent oxidoreductase-like protein
MKVSFGVFIPQGWKMELADITDPQDKWAKTIEIARLADDLGLDSVWVYDHFHNVPRPAQETVFEAWTTLAAISQVTTSVMLGQMVTCTPYREPGLTAKITANLDVISGGRLIWGVGAGWYDHEFRGYGYEFPRPAARIQMLEEAVEIVTGMWKEPKFSYEGRHYELHGAQCDPKPLQQPRPQVLIGGGGEQLTLRVVAKHADASNFGGTPEEFAHKAEVLKEHCRVVGRDYDEIQKTISGEIHIRETEAQIEAEGNRSFLGQSFDEWRRGNLVGTPEQVAAQMQTYIDLGCTAFYPWCSDYPDTETVRLLAERVVPEVRRANA